MRSLKSSVFAVFAISALLVALTVLTPARSYSQGQGGNPHPQNVNVINTAANPVPTVAQGTTSVAGSVTITGAPAVTLTGTPAVTIAKTTVYGGRSFQLPPNPNVGLELTVPPDVTLTDVLLTLIAPTTGMTIFVSDYTNTLAFHTVRSLPVGNTPEPVAFRFESGLQSAAGFRVGLTCNNISGNTCAGALMWSGYRP